MKGHQPWLPWCFRISPGWQLRMLWAHSYYVLNPFQRQVSGSQCYFELNMQLRWPKLLVLLLPFPHCGDYRQAPPCPASKSIFKTKTTYIWYSAVLLECLRGASSELRADTPYLLPLLLCSLTSIHGRYKGEHSHTPLETQDKPWFLDLGSFPLWFWWYCGFLLFWDEVCLIM